MSVTPGTLTIDKLSKLFGTVKAVDDLTLTVEPGEFLVLLGPSGCGKSTTLRMVAGFEEPSGGTIAVDGELMSRPGHVVRPERRKMGMIFQSYAIWPHMTVAANVGFGPRIGSASRSRVDEIVASALETVQLTGYEHRYPGELSGGQQQRVALARALAGEPSILLMDEPLSNLDAKLRHEMRDELRSMHQRLRFTVLYVTHDQAEAMALADRIIVLRNGVVQQVGSPEDLFKRPANPFVASFLGRANELHGTMLESGRIRVRDAELAVNHAEGVGEGDPAVVIVRPAAIRNAGTTSFADNVFSARVTDVVFLGDNLELEIYIPDLGATLNATWPPFEDVHIDEDITVRLEGLSAVAGTGEHTETRASAGAADRVG